MNIISQVFNSSVKTLLRIIDITNIVAWIKNPFRITSEHNYKYIQYSVLD